MLVLDLKQHVPAVPKNAKWPEGSTVNDIISINLLFMAGMMGLFAMGYVHQSLEIGDVYAVNVIPYWFTKPVGL